MRQGCPESFLWKGSGRPPDQMLEPCGDAQNGKKKRLSQSVLDGLLTVSLRVRLASIQRKFISDCPLQTVNELVC